MKTVVQVENRLPAFTKAEILAGERAVTSGVSTTAAALKANWRGQIQGAGLGSRLARTIQSQVYPKGQPSANAAAMVWSKAPQIVAAFETGATIRSRDGFFLAIPTPAAGRGPKGARITPGEWEQRTGLRLRLIYRRNRPSLLVAEARQTARGLAVASRSKTGRGLATIPIFILVPQVTLAKRLSLQAAAVNSGAEMATAIRAAWRVGR